MSYYEICTKILNDEWTKKWSEEQKVPYAYGDNEWVGFEDVESLKIKARYIVDKGLAGAMFWSLSLDDFSGNFCNEGKYPLINAVRNEIVYNYKPLYEKQNKISEQPLINKNEMFQDLKDPNYKQISQIETIIVYETTKKPKSNPPINNYGYFICNADGLFADTTNNCRAFFHCFRSNTPYVVKARKFCPEGTLFSQEKQVCDWPNNVLCRK